MFERYRIWKRKVEFIFCSALSDATPKQLVSYLKYWMGDQGIPLIEKWESTGKLDYSNAEETPATEGGRRRFLSSGYRLQTYWNPLDEEFKPKGNKLLSIIELWTRCKQGDKALNQWLTHVYNLVNICKYPEDSIDRIIRDVLIIGCNSNSARDKIIRQGEAITLNQVIEILQTEESTRSTMQQIQEFQVQTVNYVSYDSRTGARNPRNLLTSRIPVLITLQVPQILRKENASDVVNLTVENIYKNAEPRILHATIVASKAISRNVVRSQVTSQKTILIERISLLPQEI